MIMIQRIDGNQGDVRGAEVAGSDIEAKKNVAGIDRLRNIGSDAKNKYLLRCTARDIDEESRHVARNWRTSCARKSCRTWSAM